MKNIILTCWFQGRHTPTTASAIETPFPVPIPIPVPVPVPAVLLMLALDQEIFVWKPNQKLKDKPNYLVRHPLPPLEIPSFSSLNLIDNQSIKTRWIINKRYIISEVYRKRFFFVVFVLDITRSKTQLTWRVISMRKRNLIWYQTSERVGFTRGIEILRYCNFQDLELGQTILRFVLILWKIFISSFKKCDDPGIRQIGYISFDRSCRRGPLLSLPLKCCDYRASAKSKLFHIWLKWQRTHRWH